MNQKNIKTQKKQEPKIKKPFDNVICQDVINDEEFAINISKSDIDDELIKKYKHIMNKHIIIFMNNNIYSLLTPQQKENLTTTEESDYSADEMMEMDVLTLLDDNWKMNNIKMLMDFFLLYQNLNPNYKNDKYIFIAIR